MSADRAVKAFLASPDVGWRRKIAGRIQMPKVSELIHETDLECIVAALLTAASLGASGGSPDQTITQYAQILDTLRANGGYLNPSSASSP
jgi:hypothetical protein